MSRPGYRPGKGQHNALDALYAGLLTRQVTGCWMEISARSLMVLDHEWLVKFIEHRIADQRVLRLIRKWLNADVPNWFLLVDTKGKGPRHRVMPMDGQVRGALLQVIQDRAGAYLIMPTPE